MYYNIALAGAGALLSFGIAFFALVLSSRSFAYNALGAGMVLFGIEQVIFGITLNLALPSQVMLCYQLRTVVGALVPGMWLLFSLSFGRANHLEFISRWKWVVIASFGLPLILAAVFRDSLFLSITVIDKGSEWLLELGRSGYFYHIVSLLLSALILMNLEKTLRAFTGSMRWQIKFVVLGLFGLFASRIYVESQALLYSSLNTSLESVKTGALITADILIILSLVRSNLKDLDIYFSHTLIYNSLTFFIVGIYLLAVGIIAGFINSLNRYSLPLDFYFVLLASILLAIFLISGKMRQDFKKFIALHLRRPQYDYRTQWSEFTRRTTSLLDTRELCAAVAKIVSDTFETPSVSIWIADDAQRQITLGGSTALPSSESASTNPVRENFPALIRQVKKHTQPVDLDTPAGTTLKEALCSSPSLNHPVRYCAALAAGNELVGFVALSGRIDGVPFSLEDFELLKTIAYQLAGNLLNLRLAGRLHAARQMEAFQSVSTFFAHDLKNVANTLSVTLQNLPLYFDNEEFRADALKVISRSVEKINTMCRRFSVLREKVELQRTETDLNELVDQTVESLRTCLTIPLEQDLRSIPKIIIDASQVRKVVTNFLLNANDAVNGQGCIRVETAIEDDWVVLSVADNGCGMSKDFLRNSLFQPFKTTKAEGLGIGLFQSKMIVEAHRGAIEVESEEGKGTTFRVKLPLF